MKFGLLLGFSAGGEKTAEAVYADETYQKQLEGKRSSFRNRVLTIISI